MMIPENFKHRSNYILFSYLIPMLLFVTCQIGVHSIGEALTSYTSSTLIPSSLSFSSPYSTSLFSSLSTPSFGNESLSTGREKLRKPHIQGTKRELLFSAIKVAQDHVSNTSQTRSNIVKENPSLDVGPLIEARVVEGDAARLPCSHQPLNTNDAAGLVLWYRNDTSRPFLSYDARSKSVSSYKKSGIGSEDLSGVSNRISDENKGRIFLADGGASLVIKGVQMKDQAEYRCKVHYNHSPSVTRRLKLIVTSAVHSLHLLDSSGRSVGDHVGPFSEGAHLSLSCKAKFSGDLLSIEWLVNGKPLASSWTRTEDDLVLSNLELPLTRSHAHATLTCRVNSAHPTDLKKEVTASITDVSTTILMYYVPQATLIVDSAASETYSSSDEAKGVTLKVTEGMTVNFICAVKARPPPYNISWLHNGRKIGSGSRRWAKQNMSLVVSPVTKDDTGLYTCIASNTEGDGQSNAINLQVHHAPYCKGPTQQQVVVTKNSTVVLACEVMAEPSDVNFSWTFDPAKNYARPTSAYSSNIQIYAPNHDSKEKQLRNIHKLISPTYQNDPENPRRSLLTITPENNVQGVVCYAKNQIGRMQVPCSFTIKFVDPPQAPKDCSIKVLGSSKLRVTCAPYHQTPQLNEVDPQLSPGLSYVLSPDAKISSHLEVWHKDSLISNLSGDKPQWLIEDLPPDTDLTLRIYSTSQHSHSDPIVLFTRTRPRYLTSIQATANMSHGTFVPPLGPDIAIDQQTEGVVSPNEEAHSIGVLGLVSILVGCLVISLVLLLLSIFLLRRRGRRRQPPVVTRLTSNSLDEESSHIDDVVPVRNEVVSLRSEPSQETTA